MYAFFRYLQDLSENFSNFFFHPFLARIHGPVSDSGSISGFYVHCRRKAYKTV